MLIHVVQSHSYLMLIPSLPGSFSHPAGKEPRDGRADGGEGLHGGADGGRDPRYGRVSAAVLGDDVAVQVLASHSIK